MFIEDEKIKASFRERDGTGVSPFLQKKDVKESFTHRKTKVLPEAVPFPVSDRRQGDA